MDRQGGRIHGGATEEPRQDAEERLAWLGGGETGKRARFLHLFFPTSNLPQHQHEPCAHLCTSVSCTSSRRVRACDGQQRRDRPAVAV